MITFRNCQLQISDFENGKDLHVVKNDSGFDYYLTDSAELLFGNFVLPKRLIWTPDFKAVPELMQLFAFLDDLPFEVEQKKFEQKKKVNKPFCPDHHNCLGWIEGHGCDFCDFQPDTRH